LNAAIITAISNSGIDAMGFALLEPSCVLFEHDMFRKRVTVFRDHAVDGASGKDT
jgi:hypothetical protein